MPAGERPARPEKSRTPEQKARIDERAAQQPRDVKQRAARKERTDDDA